MLWTWVFSFISSLSHAWENGIIYEQEWVKTRVLACGRWCVVVEGNSRWFTFYVYNSISPKGICELYELWGLKTLLGFSYMKVFCICSVWEQPRILKAPEWVTWPERHLLIPPDTCHVSPIASYWVHVSATLLTCTIGGFVYGQQGKNALE